MSDYISDIVRDVINRHIDKDDCSEATFNLRVSLFNEFDRLLRLKYLHSDEGDRDFHFDAIQANAIPIVKAECGSGYFEVNVSGHVKENGEIVVESRSISTSPL